MRKWSIEDSAELYNINGWGLKYFSINEKGHVAVTPKADGPSIDLKELMEELQVRDVLKTDLDEMKRLGVLAVEMEAAALFLNASLTGKNALAICTISDSLVTGEALSAFDRETSFTQMMELALEVACD